MSNQYYQNNNQQPQGGNGQQVYKNSNVGKLYKRNGKYGEYYGGDFCGIQINGRIDQDGNISLQVPTEYMEQLKALVSTFLEQSGLGAKQQADRDAYQAKKAQNGGYQGNQNAGYQQGNNQRPPYNQRGNGGGNNGGNQGGRY